MAEEKKAGEFERSIGRLDEIIGQLDSGRVPLDDLLAYVREGSELIKRCETMLKGAQEHVDAALRREPAAPSAAGERGGEFPF